MKKTLLSLCMFFVAFAAMAQTFNEKLVVTLEGNSTPPADAAIIVDRNADGTCNFTLPNFKLDDGETVITVGTIKLNNVQVESKGSYDALSTTQNITIEPGDDPNVPAEGWIGPMLGEVPIVLQGQLNEEHFSAGIMIDFVAMNMKIEVAIGDIREYTEDLVVSVNGNETVPAPATVRVQCNVDNTCHFTLPNFKLADQGAEIPVGTINLVNVNMKKEATYDALSTNQNIIIAAGSDPNVQPDGWLGPQLGEVPIVLDGKMTQQNLYAHITISMGEMMQIEVTLGDKNTAIQQVVTTPVGNGAVYNLSGVRVAEEWNSNLPKGVYIVNGKKVIK